MTVDTPAWAREAVFYQIFPDRFAASSRVVKPGPLEAWDTPPTLHGFKGGDLLGIAEHLDDLAELGINALYLTPIFTSASNHRYHTDDYLSVDPMLGGDAALRELLDAAHGRGMRVVLDGVFNHCGRGFGPFHHVVENGAASPYRGWFHLDHERLARGEPLRAYPGEAEAAEMGRLTATGVTAGEASRRVLGYEAWWGLPAVPKLNVAHPEARDLLLRTGEHWLRFGIDGWRLDVAEDVEGAFWMEFRDRCRAVDPDAYLVAEIWSPRPDWLTGQHFDALMNYPLAEAVIGYAAGSHLDWRVVSEHHEYRDHVVPRDGVSLAAELERLLALYDPSITGVMLNLLGSHDTPRLRTVCGGDIAGVRLATLLQMTLPGAPSVYYGDEIGLEGHQDPDCRRAFPSERSAWDQGLRAYVSRLIHLRRAHRALRDGELRVLGAVGGALALLRQGDGEAWVLALNAGDATETVWVDAPEARGEPRLEALGASGGTTAEGGAMAGSRLTVHRLGEGETGGGRLEIVLAPRDGLLAQVA